VNQPERVFAEALAAHRAGDLAGAERGYRAFLDVRPGHPDTEHLLGVLLHQRGDSAAGLARIDAAIARNPDNPEYHANRALALLTLRRPADAAGAARAALALREPYPEAHDTLGQALRNLGRPGEAEVHHRRALALRGVFPQAFVNLATALFEQDRLGEAEAVLRQALAQAPRDPAAWSNLGAVLRAARRHDEAAAALDEALRLSPGDVEALVNRALVHEAQGRTADAETAYEAALTLCPGHPLARFNLGLLRLGRGDTAAGFDLYESRFDANPRDGRRLMDVPEWDGSDPAGMHLLVWRDQGLGDELLFGSCLPDLARRAGRLTVECDARLAGLFARSMPGVEVRGESGARAGCDRHVALSSLPRHLRRSLRDFRGGEGWLRPDSGRAAVWRERLAALGPGLKVGIAWRSHLQTGERRHAYTAIADWASLFTLPGVVFVCLQHDASPGELAEVRRLGAELHVWDDADLFGDLETAAALTAGLDLVISVATSAGELAGALGVPSWRVMAGRDWTMLGTSVRPWFPSQRALLPPPEGGPRAVLKEAAAALRGLAMAPPSAGWWADRALAMLAEGKAETAREVLRRSLALDPALAEAWNSGAHVALDAVPGRALVLAERALRIRSAYPEAWAHRGLALQALGRTGEAVAALRHAWTLRPADLGAIARLAEALATEGQGAAAGLAWWRIILLAPGEGEAFAGLARLRAAQGNGGAAARAWRRALAAAPERADWRAETTGSVA
jgi:tetratricopeptide (TPR) repeat protein